jgi:nitroreductase
MSAPFDLEATDRLLSTTRAVRRRLDLTRPVERAVILDCIRLAQQAPTPSNRQNWRWVVVDDERRRRALADLYRGLAEDAMPGARKRFAKDPQTERVYDSAEYLAQHLHEVPVHVIPCVEGRLAEAGNSVAAANLYGSILPAVWSFQLALRSRGLGSAFTTLHLFREAEAAAILGIPDSVTQVALLPVAWTLGTEFKPAHRPAPESIIHWNAWKT